MISVCVQLNRQCQKTTVAEDAEDYYWTPMQTHYLDFIDRVSENTGLSLNVLVTRELQSHTKVGDGHGT